MKKYLGLVGSNKHLYNIFIKTYYTDISPLPFPSFVPTFEEFLRPFSALPHLLLFIILQIL